MKFIFNLGILLFLNTVILAQLDSVSMYYADQISIEKLKYRIDVLANDSLLGRATAEEGQKRAEKFIISEFEKYNISKGNENSYLQYFNICHLKINKVQLNFLDAIVSPDLQLLNLNISNNLNLKGKDIIFCGYGIKTNNYNDYSGLDVKGKLVFVLEGTPKHDSGVNILSSEEEYTWKRSREPKENLARDQGAKGVVFIEANYLSYVKSVENYVKSGRTKLVANAEKELDIPVLFIDENIAYNLFDVSKEEIDKYNKRSIKNRSKKSIEKEGEFNIEIKVDISPRESSNVLGKIVADDPKAPWIVLSAHYDHLGIDSTGVFNGADDNGSGTASVLELARVFQEAYDNGIKPKKNILFMLVSGEEKGLLGSKFYTQNPIYSIDNTMVDLNIDMIGRIDDKHEGNSNYIYVIGADRLSQKLHDINEEMNNLYTHLDLDYTYNETSDPNRYFERSDHYNFAKKGVPVIFYFNGTHEDYHRKGDTPDKIEYEALFSRTKLIFHTAWELSQMEGALIN